jgi:large conductance mechanosensitive channel
MWSDFKAFINRGNIVDLAVGFILGVAFAAIVNSLVNDIIMPVVGLGTGRDFSSLFAVLKQGATPGPYHTVAEAHAAGAVTINYGTFVNTIIVFLIVAFVLFMIIRMYMRMKKPAAAVITTKECPFCFTQIPIQAVRCPNCTSQLVEGVKD